MLTTYNLTIDLNAIDADLTRVRVEIELNGVDVDAASGIIIPTNIFKLEPDINGQIVQALWSNAAGTYNTAYRIVIKSGGRVVLDEEISMPEANSNLNDLLQLTPADPNQVYSLSTHHHNAAYADIAHNHDAAYAALAHNHNADYSLLGHTHTKSQITDFNGADYATAAQGAKADSATQPANLIPLIDDISANAAAIAALVTGQIRRKAVIGFVNNTLAPPTEVEGDRYIIDNTGASHAGWDGAAANSIVQFISGLWVLDGAPQEGWTAYVDNDNKDALFINDGTPQWQFRATGVVDHVDLLSVGTKSHATLDAEVNQLISDLNVVEADVAVLQAGVVKDRYQAFPVGIPILLTNGTYAQVIALGANEIAVIDNAGSKLSRYSRDAKGKWTLVGNHFTLTGVSGATTLCGAKLSATSIFYYDDSNGEIRVYSHNGTDWSLTGSAFSYAGASYASMVALTSGRIVIYSSSTTHLKAFDWSGSAFSAVGSTYTISPGGECSMAKLTSTTFAHVDAYNRVLQTYSFNGSIFATVGSSLAMGILNTPAITAINETDIIFMSHYQDWIRTYRTNGSTWSLVSADTNFTGSKACVAYLGGEDFVYVESTGSTQVVRTYRYTYKTHDIVGFKFHACVHKTANASNVIALAAATYASIDLTAEPIVLHGFEADSTGGVKYKGDIARNFVINTRLTGKRNAGSAALEYRFAGAIDDVEQTKYTPHFLTDVANSFPVSALVTLSHGEIFNWSAYEASGEDPAFTDYFLEIYEI